MSEELTDELERDGMHSLPGDFVTDGQMVVMSTGMLQIVRPDLDDDTLRQNGIEPGRDFVVIFNGCVMRGATA